VGRARSYLRLFLPDLEHHFTLKGGGGGGRIGGRNGVAGLTASRRVGPWGGGEAGRPGSLTRGMNRPEVGVGIKRGSGFGSRIGTSAVSRIGMGMVLRWLCTLLLLTRSRVVGLRVTIDSWTSNGGMVRFSAESEYWHPEETRVPERIRGT
jgi:hypothetical protein